MKYIIETERLRLREFSLHDCEFIIELLNSPGWLKFIGDRNVRTTEQAKHYLENGPLKSYKINSYGLSLVEKKDDGKAIGMCGILNRDSLDNPDIGFAFLPNFNGKGYALEIVSATMIYAKDKLGISKIGAITVADNFKSIRLLEKIGLKYNKEFRFPNSEEELLLYSN
jgi:RimJ/RimL family protein N-acetyltransferase